MNYGAMRLEGPTPPDANINYNVKFNARHSS